MTLKTSLGSLVAAALVAGLLLGCEPGGIGDPCVPEDEYQTDFSGFAVNEVNVELRSFQCETRICLVNHFQGRASCRYGQTEAEAMTSPHCHIPSSTDAVTVEVQPQLEARQTEDAVYCSCRCDGPDSNARYCQCPTGFACVKLVDELGLPGGQLAGSYCIKDGTEYDKATLDLSACSRSTQSCGPEEGLF
jgi:hypothetical protein